MATDSVPINPGSCSSTEPRAAFRPKLPAVGRGDSAWLGWSGHRLSCSWVRVLGDALEEFERARAWVWWASVMVSKVVWLVGVGNPDSNEPPVDEMGGGLLIQASAETNVASRAPALVLRGLPIQRVGDRSR